MKKLPNWIIGLAGVALLAACQPVSVTPVKTGAAGHFDRIKDDDILLREFLQAMPKGGDLHNHLYGAVYAESWLRYAEEDGFCIDEAALSIRYPSADGCSGNAKPAAEALKSQSLRNRMIDHLSMRDFTPGGGESGHDQFFATFDAMAAAPYRYGDMVADAANMAGGQNILYLELMHTLELFETILPMVGSVQLSGDPAADYDLLMNGDFGAALPDMLARAKADIDAAMARKDKLLACGTAAAKPGCGVEVRFLNQPVRTLPPAAVYAHFIFGWHLTDQDARFVGNNLVAPEDDHIALRDYRLHMAQMGYLHVKLGDRNVSLHAGEVTLGLVHPDELRYHITEAVRTARADRIGHGIGIVYETGYQDLLAEMKERDIPVEINLTSNDVILGIKGEDHPYWIYKNAGVPVTLSTDDEGVSRIDLTHEYMRAADELHMDYAALKEISYNALKYAFVDEARKDELTAELDKRFAAFEAGFND